jgi:hypothetical protein
LPAALLALTIVVSLTTGVRPVDASAEKLLPETGAMVGLFTRPTDDDYTKDGIKRRWKKVENAAGRSMDLGHLFEPWGSSFPGWEEQWHVDNGRIPVVSWAHTYAGEVADGDHDAYIRARADAVKDFDEPILIRWFWEPDGNNKAKYAENPATYIAAFRHMVEIFRNRGATNAQFVWCPNAWAFTKGNAAQWYPGDGYVDWLCANGYNWNPGRAGDKWRDLAEIFHAFHDWGKGRGKPMMIGETGVMERKSGEKPGWYRQALVDMKTKLPQMDAIIFFDSHRKYDWRLASTDAAFEAWKKAVNDPYLKGGQVLTETFDAGLGRWNLTKHVEVDNGRGDESGAPSAKAESNESGAVLRASATGAHPALCVQSSVRLSDLDGTITLMRLQYGPSQGIGRVFVDGSSRELWVQSTATGESISSNQVLPLNEWHEITLCGKRGVDGGRWVLEYDGREVVDWRTATSERRIRAVRLGHSGKKKSFVVRFDDVSVWVPDL